MKKSKPSILLEVCVESAESAIAAQAGGAGRVELCDNLLEGGTTPSVGTIELARTHLTIAMNVIIRPRGGDFNYSDLEFEIMQRDIQIARERGADGVVIGILKPNGTIDKPRTRRLVELARPMSVTFHKAFDVTRDPFEALETLIELGIDRVLTSGQEASVIEGLDVVKELVQRAGNRIIIMPGGNITARNIQTVLAATGAREFHVTANANIESGMQFRNPRVFMGGTFRPPEYSRSVTDSAGVRQLLRAVRMK
ncbi:MAG TPA: copper homeostasis protein CutC [Anaerolineae bacterium]|nr:copper homeostasis protein CutC [Anaerolineae bacterium]